MSESSEQQALVTWFRLQYPKLILLSIPNGAHLAGDSRLRAIKMNKMKREGLTIGAPDLMLVKPSKHYHGLFIEMKYGKNVQRLEQSLFESYVSLHNYQYHLCYSFEAAKKAIEDYLAV